MTEAEVLILTMPAGAAIGWIACRVTEIIRSDQRSLPTMEKLTLVECITAFTSLRFLADSSEADAAAIPKDAPRREEVVKALLVKVPHLRSAADKIEAIANDLA